MFKGLVQKFVEAFKPVKGEKKHVQVIVRKKKLTEELDKETVYLVKCSCVQPGVCDGCDHAVAHKPFNGCNDWVCFCGKTEKYVTCLYGVKE